MNKKFSPLQKSVLNLYRDTLKHTYSLKFDVGLSMRNKIQNEFRENKNISRMKINRIEYLLRVGKNKFQMIKESNITGFN